MQADLFPRAKRRPSPVNFSTVGRAGHVAGWCGGRGPVEADRTLACALASVDQLPPQPPVGHRHVQRTGIFLPAWWARCCQVLEKNLRRCHFPYARQEIRRRTRIMSCFKHFVIRLIKQAKQFVSGIQSIA